MIRPRARIPAVKWAVNVRRNPLPNEDFIYSRVGEPGRRMVSGGRSFLTAFIGSDGVQALQVGRFRLTSGQVSYRMYDRYSLRQLFRSAGLADVSLTTATESRYPSWAQVNLDVSPKGQATRP